MARTLLRWVLPYLPAAAAKSHQDSYSQCIYRPGAATPHPTQCCDRSQCPVLLPGPQSARDLPGMSELTEEEAVQIANEELHALRRERRSAA